MQKSAIALIASLSLVGLLSACGAAPMPVIARPVMPAQTTVASTPAFTQATQEVRDNIQAYLANKGGFSVVMKLTIQRPADLMYPFTGTGMVKGKQTDFNGVYNATTREINLRMKPAATVAH